MSAMPSLVVTTATAVTCGHLAPVQDVPFQTRALALGAPIATVLDQLLPVGCPGVSGSPPCTKAVWTGTAPRVLAGGQPVLVQSLPPAGPVPGDGVCAGPPPTTPLVHACQPRVTAG
ncbi:hypothetical protein GCM10010302_64920 [Streptomyces polychromogenes]|uniref:Secreted protein n=1 Tax=Streptomyces polychromogenes TaxID=67342 RepID=A0ABP3FIC1_9ACTN